jgi:dolichol-phosphate mannosyltransferase
MKTVLSVVVPVFNEEQVLNELYRRTSAVLDDLGEPWELILVDDGSTDDSAEVIAALNRQDGRVKGISFSRNFGFQEAVTAGMAHASGDAVVLSDADLQDPPEVIPEMVARWRDGYDVVYGVRSHREGETWFKRLTATAFYRTIRGITSVDIPVDTGDFRLMDRRVVDAILGMGERSRFLRGMVPWVGFKQIGVLYDRQARYAGESKFKSVRKMLPFAVDAITSFSYLPLQLATYLGFIIAGVSLLAILVVVGLRLFGRQELTGQATTLVVVLFLGGVQLISLGIIGEYLGRIYDEVKGRPLFLVDRKWGFKEASAESAPARAIERRPERTAGGDD